MIWHSDRTVFYTPSWRPLWLWRQGCCAWRSSSIWAWQGRSGYSRISPGCSRPWLVYSKHPGPDLGIKLLRYWRHSIERLGPSVGQQTEYNHILLLPTSCMVSKTHQCYHLLRYWICTCLCCNTTPMVLTMHNNIETLFTSAAPAVVLCILCVHVCGMYAWYM